MARLNQHTVIEVVPGHATFAANMAQKSFQATTRKIHDIVRNELLYPARASYAHAKVRTIHDQPDVPKRLIVYLAHQHAFMVKTSKIDINPDYSVANVEHDYRETDQESASFSGQPGTFGHFATGVDMVFATPITYWPSCVQRVTDAYNAATQAGFTAVKLIGAEASVSAYQYWLTQNLKAFGSIGHGIVSGDETQCFGIQCADGNIMSQWFKGLPPSSLKPEVVYLNSCVAFQAPFGNAVRGAGPRTYIAGIVSLPEGDVSERCFAGFWESALPAGQIMTMVDILHQNEVKYGIVGEDGLFGDEGPFRN